MSHCWETPLFFFYTCHGQTLDAKINMLDHFGDWSSRNYTWIYKFIMIDPPLAGFRLYGMDEIVYSRTIMIIMAHMDFRKKKKKEKKTTSFKRRGALIVVYRSCLLTSLAGDEDSGDKLRRDSYGFLCCKIQDVCTLW